MNDQETRESRVAEDNETPYPLQIPMPYKRVEHPDQTINVRRSSRQGEQTTKDLQLQKLACSRSYENLPQSQTMKDFLDSRFTFPLDVSSSPNQKQSHDFVLQPNLNLTEQRDQQILE